MNNKQTEREAFFDLYKKGRKEATKECNEYYQNELDDLYKDYAKRRDELEKENAELKADNDARKFAMAMSEKVEMQLREQIEKMKCGQNCKHSYLYQENRKCKFTYCDCINCKDKWELRR